jgi:hypothetical protein
VKFTTDLSHTACLPLNSTVLGRSRTSTPPKYPETSLPGFDTDERQRMRDMRCVLSHPADLDVAYHVRQASKYDVCQCDSSYQTQGFPQHCNLRFQGAEKQAESLMRPALLCSSNSLIFRLEHPRGASIQSIIEGLDGKTVGGNHRHA